MNRIKLAIAIDQAISWSYWYWQNRSWDGPEVRFWRTEIRKAKRA